MIQTRRVVRSGSRSSLRRGEALREPTSVSMRAELLRREPHIVAVGDRASRPELVECLDQVRHLRVGVHRRGREAHALGAARHGRIVDRLHVDAVVRRAACRSPPCSAPDRRPSPARCGSDCPSPADGLRHRARFSVRDPLLMARRARRSLRFRWRMLASAPAAMRRRQRGGEDEARRIRSGWHRSRSRLAAM